MELDEFKTILHQHPGKLRVDDKEIVLRKRSNSFIGRIKRSLEFELAFALLFMLFTLYILYKPLGFYIHLFAALVAAFCICFSYYLFIIYKKILHYQVNNYPVRKKLETIISILRQFNRQYLIITLVMAPVILIAAFIFVNAAGDIDKYTFISHYSKQQLITYIGFSLAWYIALYFFTKWYIRKGYGHHLSGLQHQLDDLDNL